VQRDQVKSSAAILLDVESATPFLKLDPILGRPHFLIPSHPPPPTPPYPKKEIFSEWYSQIFLQ
jgi:hypothetical protein